MHGKTKCIMLCRMKSKENSIEIRRGSQHLILAIKHCQPGTEKLPQQNIHRNSRTVYFRIQEFFMILYRNTFIIKHTVLLRMRKIPLYSPASHQLVGKRVCFPITQTGRIGRIGKDINITSLTVRRNRIIIGKPHSF